MGTRSHMSSHGSLDYNFNIFPTPSDGHCLIHAISLSHGLQVQHWRPPTFEHILSQIFVEALNNRHIYLPFLLNDSKLSYIKHIKAYLLYRHYNTLFGDIVPLLIANALSILIEVITHTMMDQ